MSLGRAIDRLKELEVAATSWIPKGRIVMPSICLHCKKEWATCGAIMRYEISRLNICNQYEEDIEKKLTSKSW